MYDLKDKLSNLSEKIRSDMIPTLHEKEKKKELENILLKTVFHQLDSLLQK